MVADFKKILFFLLLIFPMFFAHSNKSEKEYLLLITGCGRSGTNYIAKLLKEAGLNIAWEKMDEDGISSWTMGVDCDHSPSGPPSKGYTFKHTFHQVRNPLDVISSWYFNQMQEPFLWDNFICKYIPEINKDEPFLVRCAKYWYYWNIEAEKKAQWRYRLEDIDENFFNELAKRLDLKVPLNKKVISRISKKANHWTPVENKLKWSDLKKALKYEDYEKIVVLAKKYGYSTQDIEQINKSIKEEPETVFTNIYNACTLGKSEEGSLGLGSTIERAKPYMEFLSNFIKANNINSVVDFGCGDWSFSKQISWNEVNYIGIDIVKSLIEKNKLKFSKPNIKFVHANFLKDSLPSADLMVCKDVLQHLPNEDILQFLKQIKQYKYCFITNDVHPYTLSSNNSQIKMGSYRFLDLTKPPFNIQGIKIFNYRSGKNIKQVLLIDNSKNISNDDVDIKDKKVLMRVDFNIPLNLANNNVLYFNESFR